MSFASPITTRLEQLVTGDHGVDVVMSPGRFTSMAANEDADTVGFATAERAFTVDLGSFVPISPVNRYDGFALLRLSYSVSVTYQYTREGGDSTEGITAQDGSGEKSAIQARAATDAFDLINVFECESNWDGTDPAIISILWDRTEPSLTFGKDLATLKIGLQVSVKATNPGSYAP